MKHFLLSIFAVLSFIINAQTGPGGIGNSNGANGQPENLIWLDASDLSSFSDGAVWLDKSGNSYNATHMGAATTAPAYTASAIGGKPALRFNSGKAGYLSIPDDGAGANRLDGMSSLTIFSVFNATTDQRAIISKRQNSSNRSWTFYFNNSYQINGYAGGTSVGGGTNMFGSAAIGTYQLNGSLSLFHNGAQQATGGSGVTIPDRSENVTIGVFDESDNGTRNFGGDIAEIIVYNSNLSPLQKALVYSYLSNKYSITTQEANIAYSPSDGLYYEDLTGYARSSVGFNDFGPSSGLYISLNDAAIDDYITAAHNGAINNLDNIQTGADVTASGAVAAWNRNWYVEKGGVSTAKISFSFPEGFEEGSFPQELSNYVLLRKDIPGGTYSQVNVADKGVELGERVWFEVADADFEDGYYTLGTLDQTASPLEGGSTRIWYSLISGDWDNWEVWTLDPSGALPNNPNHYTPTTSPTAASDKVVVLNGKTVTVSTNDKIHQQVTVDGRLDLKGTSGHDFSKIRGRGRILLSDNNFPAGDATHFSSAGQGEGTVVYYGNGFDLTQNLTFYNLEIDLSLVSNKITLLNNLTINGEFRVKNGEFQFNNGTVTNALNVTVNGSVVIEENGKLLTGAANARHQFNLYGDFTNDGSVAFTNRVSAVYDSEATDGIVDVNFLNDSKNQLAFFNGPSKFYRIKIDKGTDATYELVLEATDSNYFNLLGYANQNHGDIAQLVTNTNALGLLRGTVRIKSNINIPVLNNSSNYNISEAARLWVDGGTVSKTSGTAIVPYGVIQVSAGVLNALVQSGITTRGNALVKVEGGTLNINQLRTSNLGAENVGGYVQSGGVTNVLGGTTNVEYYSFNLTYPGNVFNMSGGTLHIQQANSKGGVFIASEPVNQNVTGGTVILDINNDNDFALTSKAPFWNLIIRKTFGTKKHVLAAGVDVGTDNVNLSAQPLKVLNDFTIESDSWLDANGQDVSIGRNFTIEDNALYEFHENTTTFNGTEDATLYVGDITALTNPSYTDPEGANAYADWEHPFYKLVINKPSDKTLFFASKNPDYNSNTSNVKTPAGGKNINDWRSNLVKVIDGFELLSGKVDLTLFSLRLYSDITNYGILAVDAEPINAIVRTRKESVASTRIVKTTSNAYFGNIRLNSDNTILQFTSDVYIGRMEYKHGRMNISKYNLKIDDLVISFENEARFDFDGDGNANENNEKQKFSVADMIITDGNASDGGLSLLVNSAKTYYFPIGVGTDATELARNNSKFTPVELAISSCPSSGYVTIRPVDATLQTTNLSGGNVLDYYWRISCSGFTTNPVFSNIYMLADDRDIPGAFPTDFYSGWVEDNKDANANGFNYDRFYEALDDVNQTKNFNSYTYNTDKWIRFNNTGADVPPTKTLVGGNFTAGVSIRFVGAPTIFYNRKDATRDWNNNTSWYNSPTGTTNPPSFPAAGDIVVIRGNNFGDAIKVNGSRAAAEIIFQREGIYSDIEDIPRLHLNTTDVLNVSKITGIGELYLQQSLTNSATVNADIGEFAANDTSVVIFYMTQNGTYNVAEDDLFTEFPILRIYGQLAGYNRTVLFNYDFNAKQLLVDGQSNLMVGGNYTIKNRTRLGYTGGGRIIFPNGTESYRLKTGDFVTGRAKNSGDNSYQLTVQTGGGNGIDHFFEVERNIDLNFADAFDEGTCTVDLFSTMIDNNVILHLSGEGNHAFDDNYSAGNSSVEFYKIDMDKGSDITSTYTFNDKFTLNGSTSGVGLEKALILENGKLILDDLNINIDLTTGNDDLFIPQTAALEVQQGQVTASGNSGILLDGQLIVSGGTVDMSGGDNHIQYSASSNAAINVSAGSLIVGSQIRRGLTSSEGILDYTQSGGTVVVGNDVAPENSRAVFEVLNAGSNFSFTGGELQIARAQNNPAIASVYLAPETVTINDAAVLRIGNVNTPSNQTIGLYSNVEIPNLVIDNSGGNSPILRQWTVPLTVSNLLEVGAGTVFDADGNDLILKGDFLSLGDFIPNGNTTFFSGAGDQDLTGDLTFFNLTKSSPGELSLNNAILIQNVLRHEVGLLVDNGNAVSVAGNLHMLGNHQWGGSGRGIVMNGLEQQTLYGSGSFGKLTTNNPEGITVNDGNTVYVNQALQMEQGVLNVGSNLLVLDKDALIIEENPFSATNMIQTNISFTDNGVKKFLPSGAGNFTFPVGSGGKYTPVKLAITANSNGTGSFLVKPAGEFHPSVLDKDNVLNYHWVVRASGLSGFAAEARMKYDIGDVKGNIADYITARLLADGSGDWNKFSGEEVIDESNRELVFSFPTTNDAGISGDYTAGLDAAIPDKVPTYITKANGFWNNASIWDTYPVAGGSIPESGPRGSMVIVNHAVEMPLNYTSSYRTTIAENGVLAIGSTFGHRLGEVFGSGVLSLESGDMPAGFYEEFLKESGGTLRFGGNSDYDILSAIHQLNNLELTGLGERRFPNINVQLTGNLLIDGPQAKNEQYKTISVKGDVVFESGSFDAGTGATSVFTLNGSATQTLSGSADFSGVNSFNRLTVNNPAGVVFALDADVKDVLTLLAGRIIVNETAQFRIDNYISAAIVGASSTHYIDGPLYKRINSGASFDFPLGDESRYGNIKVTNVSASGMWRAQYHSSSPSGAGLSTGSKEAPVQYVSSNEYWNIEAPVASTAEVTVRWDAASGVNPAEAGLRGVQWLTDKWHEVTLTSLTGNASAGTAKTSSTLSFNANAGGNYITFGAITIPAYNWTGAVSTDWFTTGNWTNSIVPSGSSNTTISATTNKPVISGTDVAQVKDLTIAPTASLTLNPGARLTVNGNLVTNDKLIVKNTVLEPVSVITSGTVTGKTNIQWPLRERTWWYIGHSVTGVLEADYVTSFGAVDFALNQYTGSAWNRIAGIGDANGAATYLFNDPLEGYSVTIKNSEDTLSYNGVLNAANYTSKDFNAGWYLVANPYPSYIDVSSAGFNMGSFSKTVYIRGNDNQVSTYNTLLNIGLKGGSKYISPGQCMWLRTYTDLDKVTISNAVRTHAPTGNALKSGSMEPNDRLRLMLESEYGSDESVVIFNQNGSETYTAYDSEKLMNGGNIANLYLMKGVKEVAISSMPELSSGTVVPLAYKVAENGIGQMTIKATNLDEFMPEVEVYLVDKMDGVTVDLRETPSYTFTPSIASATDRFELRFETSVSTAVDEYIKENVTKNQVLIYGVKQRAHVKVDEELLYSTNKTIKVYNVAGQLMATHELNSVLTEFDLPQRDAAFIIRVNIDGVVHKAVVIGMD